VQGDHPEREVKPPGTAPAGRADPGGQVSSAGLVAALKMARLNSKPLPEKYMKKWG